MIFWAIVLHGLVFLACLGAALWKEYHDNFGERLGLVVVGITAIGRAVLMFEGLMPVDLSDVLMAGGIALFAWGMLCAKRRNRRLKLQLADSRA